MTPVRRDTLVAITALATIAASACAHPATSNGPTGASSPSAEHWIATWAPSQLASAARPAAGTRDPVATFANTTIRQIIRTTIGGSRVRIRISNEYGDRPLALGSVHVARTAQGSSIDASTDRALTFGGAKNIVVRTGATVTSDPIAFDVPQLANLTITMYLPDSARTSTRHSLGLQTIYIARTGDQTASASFTADSTTKSWLFLTGVDVINPRATGAIVTIGNSITDGAASTADSNRRWPDVLARRLLTSQEPPKAVVNAGISGNRVLTFGAGPSLVSRFDRDVIMQPGVTHVILLEGINDIGRAPPSPEAVTADEIIYGYKQVIARAHERGIMIFGATLTPAANQNAESQAKREAVNTWIRTSGMFDGVIDFDKATRDPAKPSSFLPAYDSGDHLHPSDAGYKAMGEAIDLTLFRRNRR
ncbi:MAG TPA: SGNH/GDSL hydrolase family protein [Gemmatimonadaceae bacterium]|nr:SGNH/GDSL hydrolase family protein [Gemmatimonadaceae bacterium]